MIARRFLLSFLDLICCALGAGIILFLMNTVPRGRSEVAEPVILIACRQADRSPAREVGIQYKPPSTSRWTSALGADCPFHYVSHEGRLDDRGVAVLLIEDAEPGVWEFRGYVVDYGAQRSASRTMLELSVSGLSGPDSRNHIQAFLPGDRSSKSLRVTVTK